MTRACLVVMTAVVSSSGCSESPARPDGPGRDVTVRERGADRAGDERAARDLPVERQLLDATAVDRRPDGPGAGPSLGPRPVASTQLSAGTLFASPNGSGTSCTQSAPCTIAVAIGKASPGSVVFLLGGSYDVAQNISFNRAGTAAKPIIYESYPGQLAVLDGSSQPAPANVYIRITGSWQIVRKLEIRNMPQQGLYIDGNDNVVEGLHVHHNKLSGIHVYSPYDEFPYGKYGSRNTITDCTVHDNSDAGLTGGPGYANGGNADGISISSGEANKVLHCLVYLNSDDGVDTWRSTNSQVAYTITHSNGIADGNGNGFKAGGLPPSSGTVVESCISYKNLVSGFDFNSGVDVKFRRSTSWANKSYGFVTGSSTTTERCISSGDAKVVTSAGVFTDNSWQRTGTVAFISTDPTSPDFLRPTAASGFSDIGAYSH